MNLSNGAKESIAVVATTLRYGIAEHIARRVRRDEPILVPMVGLVLADILDGVIFRKVGLDTPARRLADSLTDQASIARVAYEVARRNPAARPYIGILAARALYSGAINVMHQAATSEVTKGGDEQRAISLLTAVFGVAAASGNQPLTHLTGIAASAVAVASLPSHTRELGIMHDTGIREL